MAIPATESCNPCDNGRHQHMSSDQCERRMYHRDFYCTCYQPLTVKRCAACEQVIRGAVKLDGKHFLHPDHR